MQNFIQLSTPLTKDKLEKLQIGQRVLISGTMYVARDAAHKNMVKSLENGEELPFDPKDQIIFYSGPCPAKPGYAIGPMGPTTASRMDPYTPQMLEQGLSAMLSKGNRSETVIESIKKNKAVYFICTAGIGALLSRSITKYEVIAYHELGTEALAKIEVKDFPATVGIDCNGNSFYKMCRP